MASVKATFTLDEETVRKLALASRRLRRPKSQIVREAINEFGDRDDRLSERERSEKLRIIDKFASEPPTRTQAEVDAELAEIREVRRLSGEHRSDRLGE